MNGCTCILNVKESIIYDPKYVSYLILGKNFAQSKYLSFDITNQKMAFLEHSDVNPTPDPNNGDGGSSDWWVYVLVIVAALVLIAAVMGIRNHYAKK
jgi:hypothetical protein